MGPVRHEDNRQSPHPGVEPLVNTVACYFHEKAFA